MPSSGSPAAASAARRFSSSIPVLDATAGIYGSTRIGDLCLVASQPLATGYQGSLFILAFDHRGSFQKKWYGIEGEPTAEESARIADGKQLIFEGLNRAVSGGAETASAGGLVDEQYGAPNEIPQRIRAAGVKLAMPVEKSGQEEFDFEYGEEFGAHIERFDPDLTKVLVRYNPDGAAEMNRRQAERLRELSRWLAERERKLLFELLVPATDEQLASVDGSSDRYDAELRPALMARAIAELQDAGIETDVWKIEGLDRPDDCRRIVAQCRAGGRDGVVCVVLGRGADSDRVDGWLEAAAGVDGYVGFAIGRSIWGDPLAAFLAGELAREAAAERIADNFLRFVSVYEDGAAR
jgi:myo-inositol catabolism protein IolC